MEVKKLLTAEIAEKTLRAQKESQADGRGRLFPHLFFEHGRKVRRQQDLETTGVPVRLRSAAVHPALKP